LAVASIILGSFLAASHDVFNWAISLLCVLTAVFLQILSNLANDYGDSVHGADHGQREGPQRAVQSGIVTAVEMKRAMGLFATLSAITGLLLIFIAFEPSQLPMVLLFIVLGGGAVAAAVLYTAGSNPYGYVGLGDLFVLIFFGWVGTMGTYFLQAQSLDWMIFLPATAVGFLSVGVLNVNNIRDIKSDAQAGKYSIPVRVGPEKARQYHWFLLGTAVLCATIYVLLNFTSGWQFLYALSLPLLWKNGTAVSRTDDPVKLNPMLKQLSLSTLVFVITFGIGQLI
jgi:1,4-dihydroxy-2-naphthoate octaprenyltransferase